VLTKPENLVVRWKNGKKQNTKHDTIGFTSGSDAEKQELTS